MRIVIHRNANGLKQTSNSENNQRQKPNGTNSDWNSRPNQGGAEYAPKVEGYFLLFSHI